MNDYSRRDFFRYLTLLGLTTFSTTSLYAKGTKQQYQYQENPKNGKQCSNCSYFIAKTNECKMIDGTISPKGWCAAFLPKSAN